MRSKKLKDFTIDDIELAAQFAEYSGGKPVDVTASKLNSISLYEFRVSHHMLRIQDIDIVTLKTDISLKVGREDILLKRISKNTKNLKCCIYRSRGQVDYVQLIKNRDICHELEVLAEDGGDNTLVSMKIKADFTFEQNCSYALYLHYEVGLGDGPCVFYTGAIQPSDYVAVRRIANLEKAEKRIWICIWSKNKQPFSVWQFNGSAPVISPPAEPAEFDNKWLIYKFSRWFGGNITNWDRAIYFSVFSDVRP